MKVTVRRLHGRDGIAWPRYGGGWHRAEKVWSVYANGERLHQTFVVLGEPPSPFLTMIRVHNGEWKTLTHWHVGISPGDLARKVVTAS